MNGQILPVSRGKNVRCKSNRYAISQGKYFGFVDSVPPFYLHKKQRNISLWAVELKYFLASSLESNVSFSYVA
jgi:hypothetical protein